MAKTRSSKFFEFKLVKLVFKSISDPGSYWIISSTILSAFFPVIGVIFFGWDPSFTLFYFWIDNVFLGVFYAMTILFKNSKQISIWKKLTQAVGFIFTWAFVSFIHGAFVAVFTLILYELYHYPSYIYGHESHISLSNFDYSPALAAVVVGFIYRFANFLDEPKRKSIPNIMVIFNRVLILHFALLLFAFIGFVPMAIVSGFISGLSLYLSSSQIKILELLTLFNALIPGLMLGFIRSWWDFRIIFLADKMGPYTTKSQKRDAKKRRLKFEVN